VIAQPLYVDVEKEDRKTSCGSSKMKNNGKEIKSCKAMYILQTTREMTVDVNSSRLEEHL